MGRCLYLALAVFSVASSLADITAGSVIRSYSELAGAPYTVSHDGRSLRVGGRPLLSFSGSVHYPRSTPAQWPAIFASMKASGLNTIDSYVFWNFHVRSNSSDARQSPDYSGRGNVTLFLTLAAEADMFVIWRLGPYINAEWLDSGYPAWMQDMCRANGTGWRKAEQPYMDLNTEWMTSHVAMVEPFFNKNGGPIILLQMDNELGGATPEYLAYLKKLADDLVPTSSGGPLWIMCHGDHFDTALLTCNGVGGSNDGCRKFSAQQLAQGLPALWTEDEQWYDRFGQAQAGRNTSASARGMAAFIAVGGSLHNFYMWHGGSMWGNWSDTNRGSRLTPSYANSAPLASDGSLNKAKNAVLTAFHELALKHADTILGTPISQLKQTILGGSPNCKDSCMPLCDSTCQWSVEMAGDQGAASMPLSFVCNDDTELAVVKHSSGAQVKLAPMSCKVLHGGTGGELWDSHVDVADEVPAPYTQIPTLVPGSLKWETWSQDAATKHQGDWYRAHFTLPQDLPEGASISLNLTGFSSGNVFVNDHHIGYYNLAVGVCSQCAKGGFGCWPEGAFAQGMCGKPTQDCYAVPPEWLLSEKQNELLIFNGADDYCVPTTSSFSNGPCTKARQNGILPPPANETRPELASVVMRKMEGIWSWMPITIAV